nr:molecular chaperone HtpG [Thermoflexibacter sp.]
IKKFLYSDHEIFLRELISNAMDATKKIESLAALGEYKGEVGDTKVKVNLNIEAKTITVSDNGVGMTAEEVKKYINQIAFSGATDFIEKYKDKKEEVQQLIGKFGLGFYSAFMVAEKVQLVTKSWQEETQAVMWTCDGSTEFELTPSVRSERGTDVILHIAQDSEEFLDKYKIESILEKYCKFLPYEIEFGDRVINNTKPLWTKNPTDIKDEDYLAFYKELYPMSEDPLFWIHLNVDYPFNLTGVLYFPKIKNDLAAQKNKIQLYQKQVFITDEVKEIVPEFLTLLHGVIDSPDIPLNVSRSFLQADSNVKKINSYITRKVADKLQELFKNDRPTYESKWESLDVFVKFGMITDDKFYEKATQFVLLEDIDNKRYTFEEYKDFISANQKDKNENIVILYTTDAEKQDTFIQSAKKRSYSILKLDRILDSHFINTIERKLEKTTLKRIDSETIDKLIDKGENATIALTDSEKEKIIEIFKTASGRAEISVEPLPTDELPVLITLPEFMRRMRDMAKMGGGMDYFANLPEQYNIVINGNHQLINKILAEENADNQQKTAKQLFDLVLLSQNMLNGQSLTAFINRSLEMI